MKNELTNAVGLASSHDANGKLTNRGYDATVRKTYLHLYDDENQLFSSRECQGPAAAVPYRGRWDALRAC